VRRRISFHIATKEQYFTIHEVNYFTFGIAEYFTEKKVVFLYYDHIQTAIDTPLQKGSTHGVFFSNTENHRPIQAVIFMIIT